jgi:LmbE family N-acetylglucosaminyl deacetylase
MTDRQVVVHVSPHPDDEAIAAGMTLTALAMLGWRVINLLMSAGRPGDESRRRAEATEAARRGGFHLDVDGDIAAALERHRPTIVMSPQPHDAHPAHEAVARAVRDALESSADPPVWWMWGLWAELAVPTLYVPFGDAELARALEVLAAYEGELARNDYRRVVRGRAASNTVIGSERVFGFGSGAASDQPFAELLTEAVRRDRHWYAGARRVVDLESPLGDGAPSLELLDEWITDRPR